MKCCESTLESIVGTISRRDFMKVCTAAAVYMGLSESFGPKIAEAATAAAKRPPVIWLSGQECTGCTESLLRTSHPSIGTLLLDLISLDYSETLNTGAGHQAEECRKQQSRERDVHDQLLDVSHGRGSHEPCLAKEEPGNEEQQDRYDAGGGFDGCHGAAILPATVRSVLQHCALRYLSADRCDRARRRRRHRRGPLRPQSPRVPRLHGDQVAPSSQSG